MAEQVLKLNPIVEEFENERFHQDGYDLKESNDSVSDEAKFASFSQHSFLPSYHQSVCSNTNNNPYEFGTISGEFVSVPVQRLVSNGLPLKKRTKGLSKLSMRGNNSNNSSSRTKANRSVTTMDDCSSSAGSDIGVQSNATSKRNQRGTATIPCHPCPECHKAFSSPGKLQQHSFVHSGERPFKCTECEKGFSSRFKLMRHALIHSNDRRYKCSFCDRCFHRKDHLKNHLQVHNPNKKTYKCGQCEKEYNSRLSFRKHVAIHAAESGDLECKVCGKRFGCTEEIMYHLKVHTGSRTIKSPNEKKFKCEFCERRFFTRKDVKRHLVVHTGRRDFLCQFCPQRFGRKDHLVRHIKKSHSASKMKENATSTQEHCIGAPIYPHFDFLPSPSHLVPISQSDFPPHFSQHLHHHQRHGSKDPKHTFHTSPCMTSSDTSAVSPMPTIYSSSCTASAYLIAPFSPEPPHEYKLYDEIKIEREDDQMNACSSLDISQLLGYLPLPSSSSSQSGFIVSTSSSPLLSSHPPQPPPSSSSPPPPPSSSVSAMVVPSSVITSLDQLPLSVTPLPQFNQAFQ